MTSCLEDMTGSGLDARTTAVTQIQYASFSINIKHHGLIYFLNDSFSYGSLHEKKYGFHHYTDGAEV